MKFYFELETYSGLEAYLEAECRERLARGASSIRELRFMESGRFSLPWNPQVLALLLRLSTATVVSVVVSCRGKRPRVFRGHRETEQIRALVSEVRQHSGRFHKQTFRLEMKGNNSPEAGRLREHLERALGLRHVADRGEHFFRLRRALQGDGWDFIIRATPKPLSVRSWRRGDYRGALSAPVASAIGHVLHKNLGGVKAPVVLDPCCGSGSLLVELAQRVSTGGSGGFSLLGGDISAQALSLSIAHFEPLRVQRPGGFFLYRGRADRLPLSSNSVNGVVSNLPWGEVHGERAGMTGLYSSIFRELGRVVVPDGPVLLLTQAASHLREALCRNRAEDRAETPFFRLLREERIALGAFTPTLFHCQKVNPKE
ncbi:hypothetical protein MRY87_01345 [bacterium]|nr:hypothetical protein [bacterium]